MTYDFKRITNAIRNNAQPKPTGYCARSVRQALEAGGFDTNSRPVNACDYGPFLLRLGFEEVTGSSRPGDIIVIQPPSGSGAGHIAMLADNGVWYSDFEQIDKFGGPSFRAAGVPHTHYRHRDARDSFAT